MSVEIIARHLNITPVEGKYPFRILDAKPDLDLYLVHYDPDEISTTPKDSPVRDIRGVIVSEQKGVLVPSFGYTPTIICDDFDPETSDALKDKDDCEHSLKEFGMLRMLPLLDGTLIRVWKYNGNIFISSHKKIDVVNSRWGTSGKFKDLFLEYTKDRFELESLFSSDKEGEVQIHSFLLVNIDLLVSSKLPLQTEIKSGFVVYIDSTNCELPVELPSYHYTELATCKDTVLKVKSLKTRDECNLYLHKGFYPDQEEVHSSVSIGEGIILYNGKTMLKVVSKGYHRRAKLVDNEPNILLRVYNILSESQIPKEGFDSYLEKFPAIPCPTCEQITELKEPQICQLPVEWKTFTEEELTDTKCYKIRENRFINATTHYALSLPPCHQKAALTCIDELIRDRHKVFNIMSQNLERFSKGQWGEISPRDQKVYERIQKMINDAKSYARTRYMKGERIPGNNEFHTLRKLTLDNLRGLVMREYGCSLYKIVRVLVADPAKRTA